MKSQPAHRSPRVVDRPEVFETIAFAKRREKARKARKAAKATQRRNR